MAKAIVVGAGAREHALMWGLHASGAEVFGVGGNAGMASLGPLFEASSLDWVKSFGAERPLVVIGPEAPLASGWADNLRALGFPVVGPSQRGARLESSKRYAKEVMVEAGIPTAGSRLARTSQELRVLIEGETRWPHVMKQSGLAGGKGVVVVKNLEDAVRVWQAWDGREEVFADGVLWEDFVAGEEVSVHVVTNGASYRWLPVSQDYKRLSAHPGSPNTGGMGAVAPVYGVDEMTRQAIDQKILQPLMRYLTTHGIDYRGILYVGLMLTDEGPYVLEFNVRLGDPETEVLVPILDLNWYEWWWQVSQGEVPEVPGASSAAVAVVMAAAGYPGDVQLGEAIYISPEPEALIFFGATREVEGQWVVAGGRVLTVVGRGPTEELARARAYRQVAKVEFPNAQWRTDIAGNNLQS